VEENGRGEREKVIGDWLAVDAGGVGGIAWRKCYWGRQGECRFLIEFIK
jgi:hypothetical protein